MHVVLVGVDERGHFIDQGRADGIGALGRLGPVGTGLQGHFGGLAEEVVVADGVQDGAGGVGEHHHAVRVDDLLVQHLHHRGGVRIQAQVAVAGDGQVGAAQGRVVGPLDAGQTQGDAALVLVIVGDVAAPFAALDDRILTVIGEQVGAALEREELSRGLAQRSEELERLSVRMLQEHEAQRRRLGRELHDETAQVFSALKLQLGLLREESPTALQEHFDRLIAWVDRGSGSIRNATEGLRPAVLDDLGLLPALRALVADVREWSGLTVTFDSTAWTTTTRGVLAQEAEVALFRGLQEALSNVVRHAQATTIAIALELRDGRARLTVRDDGVGLPADRREHLATGPGRSGLIGMRERVAAAGGVLTLAPAPEHGLIVHIDLPLRS